LQTSEEIDMSEVKLLNIEPKASAKEVRDEIVAILERLWSEAGDLEITAARRGHYEAANEYHGAAGEIRRCADFIEAGDYEG
jgi:hypothetical protein